MRKKLILRKEKRMIVTHCPQYHFHVFVFILLSCSKTNKNVILFMHFDYQLYQTEGNPYL